jgi:hypothetical protein
MLPSVLFARDKWLKPGGLILPSHATVYIYDTNICHTHTYTIREKIFQTKVGPVNTFSYLLFCLSYIMMLVFSLSRQK